MLKKSTCLLWMSLWLHISARPQLSDGRRGQAIRPSRAEPHLHLLDAPTRRQDKRYTRWLCSSSGFSLSQGPDERVRPGSTHHQSHRPSHRASMSSLIALERLLWLRMTEMKEADKFPFLDVPVSSGNLFGPAVEGFAECFTEAQKSSQVMRHFLPKHTSSSSASSRPRHALTQQTAKSTPNALEPRPPEGRRYRGCSRSAQRYPFPERQGPPAQDRLGSGPSEILLISQAERNVLGVVL